MDINGKRLRLIARSSILVGVGFALCADPAVASSGDMPSLVHDIGYSILFAGLLAVIFTKLRIPTIAAFLLAGVIVGPIGARLVTDPDNINTISEFGLLLLLFLIGLELDIRKLLSSGKPLILTGLLQYPLCVAFGFVVAKFFIMMGLGGDLLTSSPYVPLYIGFLMAASSTLLVVKLFQETFQLDTVTGRMALGILIFQDIWAIIVIAIQPNFDDPQIAPILLSFVGIGLLTVVAILIAKYLLPVFFGWIAKLPELILVAAIGWCFAVVFFGVNIDAFTEAVLGFNLHLAVGTSMGALIAGASIAALPYSTEIVGKVGIVKDFFVTLFFVGLGMGIPVPDSVNVLLMALVFTVVVILARFLLFFPLQYFTGLDRRNSMVSSIRLAQASEFTLVIAFLGLQLGHISSGLNSVIIFAFVITALLTPTLFKTADSIHDALGPFLQKIGFKTPPSDELREEESYRVALLGFHRVASSILHELKRDHSELMDQILVVDFNVNIHERIAAHGPTVKYGDLSNSDTLHHAGVGEAQVIVCTIPDDMLKGTSNYKIVEALRQINPTAIIIANAIELVENKRLYEAGADYVYMSRIDTARAVITAIEKALHGDIGEHRAAREKDEGMAHERAEVFV